MASGVFHQLYFHVVWATIHRSPVIDTSVCPWLLDVVRRECLKRKASVLVCNAMPDHVHLLVSMPPIDLANFVGQVKGASAYHFNPEFSGEREIKWQGGFGIVSLRATDIPKVTRYVENQEVIHAARGNSTSEILERSEQTNSENES